MAPLQPYSQSLQNITRVNETKKVFTARELEQRVAWFLPGRGRHPQLLGRGGFALRHPTGIRGYVSLSALPVSKNSHTAATVHLGLLVRWVQSATESDAVLLGPTVRGSWELVVGSHQA